jgi:xanthine dehydrogenase accessory factor
LLAEAVARAVAQDRSQLIELEGRRIFAHVSAAPLRLVVVGAVHLTQALGDLATLNGFEVIVIDPRTAFATPERFPRATLVHDWPDSALAALCPDSRTAVVVLSHDAKLDEPALVTALRSPCFYIGALGSQRTQQARRRRLADEGFGEAELARIHGPVGLDIGALTTPEIAVAIMAEIIQARRKPRSPSIQS